MMPTFHIPEEFWGANLQCEADGRLLGVLGINGARFHVEALPVTRLHGYQVGADPVSESRLEGLIAQFDVPGFQTVEIRGRSYVLVITPLAA